MVDQRTLFKEFYSRVCGIDKVNGRAMGREVYELLCNQTIALKSYQEIEHESYGTSAYFSIYLHVCRDGKQYYLPGNLLLSMRYFNRAKPVVILKREGKLLSFNHSIVRDNGIVHTQFLKEWEKHPSVVACLRDIVDLLQGNPYDYEQPDSNVEDHTASEQVDEPKPQPPPVQQLPPFNDNIPYTSLKKGAVLGKGSFAVAYVAEWEGKKVAMKEWTAALGNYEATALKREIEIQRSLNHPNCLRLFGLSQTPTGKPVLVMELADCSLTDLTTKRERNNKRHPEKQIPKLSNQEKYRIIREIAEGLTYVHSRGYVHRDIKLDNILMKDGHPKIADFGLARELSTQSMTITFAGSPVFMAPELIMGQKVTNTIDCYSFGCIVTEIIYELTCYWDYKVTTEQAFYRDIRGGMHPTIMDKTPAEVKYLLLDCFKRKSSRPPMSVLLERISMWEPDKWNIE